MSANSLLLVDDNEEALSSLSRALRPELGEAKLFGTTDSKRALEIFSQERPQVSVIDLDLGTGDGTESGFSLLKGFVKLDPSARIIVLTGHGSVEVGVRALTLGAANFLEKPADVKHLAALVIDGFKQAALRREFEALRKQEGLAKLHELVGISPAIQRLREEILLAASSSHPVLLVGETGTGKGVCARLIHQNSSRSKAPFVRSQPAFGQHDLIASELFGHKKGAFTGAIENRSGLIKEANGGTLFVDEIQELPNETQVMLLDTLQERRYRPIGANAYEQSDFRLISAINLAVKEVLSSGKLRQDFYHRIAFSEIELPTLRARKQDIPSLVESFITNLQQRDASQVAAIEEPALKALIAYDWPGNIRELEAVVETGAHRAQFRGSILIAESDIRLRGSPTSSGLELGLHEQIETFKLRVIRETLDRYGGNQVRAAEVLGIDRGMIRRALKRSR